jgi:hypothetical protein
MMEVAALQQPTPTEPIASTMENSMDIDMDIDLGPLPEADAIETVSLFRNTCSQRHITDR